MCSTLLGDAGLHLADAEGRPGVDARDLQQVLSDKMEMNAEAANSFITGLRMYLADDAFKARASLSVSFFEGCSWRWQNLTLVRPASCMESSESRYRASDIRNMSVIPVFTCAGEEAAAVRAQQRRGE